MGTTAVETTPVAPAAPIPAPPAPAAPVVASPGDLAPGMSAMIDKITQRAGQPREAAPVAEPAPAEAPADPAAPPTETAPVTDSGVAADGTTEQPIGETAPPTMVAEIKADDPEGEVVLRARDPETGQFSPMDQKRTYELSIRDKETGEARVYNKTLPELMVLAKGGIHLNRVQGELRTFREAVPQMHQQLQQRESDIAGLQALAYELLTAPEEVVVARREAYAAEQTPDKVFARREAALTAREQSLRADETSRTQAAQTATVSALASRIGPVIQEVDDLVGKELAAGKLMTATAHLYVNGRIPLENLPQVEAFVLGPYREWAKTEAAKRSTQTAEIERQRAQTAETQRRAQIAANQAGAASRPVGGMQGVTASPQPKPKNVEDAISRIISGNGRTAA